MSLVASTWGVRNTRAFCQTGIGVSFTIGTTNRIVIGGTNAVLLVVTSGQQESAGKEDDKGFHGGTLNVSFTLNAIRLLCLWPRFCFFVGQCL